MTEIEKNIIKNEIIDAIASQSKMIEQLTPATSISGSDMIELDGGRYATVNMLMLGAGAITVQIITDKGNVILNGEGQRTLTAYVFRRSEDITAQIAQSYFSWERTSADTTGDRIWNRLHKGIGNVCTVTEQDITRSAQFTCVVDLEQLNIN